MTYSIVARDPGSGQMGVAVQSHWFSTGAVVTWGEAGVGVVATQAFAEPAHGPRGLSLMRSGLSARDTLRALLSVDPGGDRRQVAMVDAAGTVAAHTGERCIAEAGHRMGETFSAQANMMLRDTVPDAMAESFGTSDGDLTDRLLAALDAAEGEGGDIRGRQSAAILVVGGERAPHAHAGRVLDLRVEDHPEPLNELRRLVGVKRAYERMNAGDERLAADDIAGASGHYDAAQAAVPDNIEFTFWHAVMTALRGEIDQARALLARTHDAPGEWAELLRRLPAAGLLGDDPDLAEKLLAR
jgi:uncharacterized Ntn-hydrolase superfamily protein